MYQSERADPDSEEWKKELDSRGYIIGCITGCIITHIIGEGHYSTVCIAKNGGHDLALKIAGLRTVTGKYRNKFYSKGTKLIQKVKHS